MRVLHIISAIDPLKGGPITALLSLVQAQQTAGMEVSLAATFLKGESNTAAEELRRRRGIEVELIGPAFGPLRWHPKIRPTLRRLISRADVVHVHALWEEIQHRAAVLSRSADVPYLITPHGMLTRWSLAQSRLKKRLYMKWRMRQDLDGAAALHYTTEAERDASAVVGLKAAAFVEALGVDLSEFATLPPAGTFRRQHPQIAGRRIVLFLGRVHPGKGLELLVPAFAQAAPDDAVLVIVGPDSENFRAVVEADVAAHGLRDRVIFTGMLRGAERIAALRDAELFIMPSFHENFGLAVIEALAAEVPVIVSNEVNVHAEISAAGVGGVVPTQVKPLAAEIARWMNDAELRRQASQRAIPFVREHYDWNKIAAGWVDHYQAIASSKKCTIAS
jgi:glycosyltransferase involved in cell wall biosynthesis